MHLVHPLSNICIYTHTPLKMLVPLLKYIFTPVITRYQFRPYIIDIGYVVSEYNNNKPEWRNIRTTL